MKTIILTTALLLTAAPAAPLLAKDGEPDKVRVQHILIGFKRTIPGKKLDRTKAQAKALALSLADRAREGEDFAAMAEEYTDDSKLDYLLTNRDVPRVAGGKTRREMASKFGDVAFGLEVGEIGIAGYHPGGSPYGWHVIKRVE